MDADPRLLRAFVVVAEERHFSRAAERLRLAQPPLSQQIRRLEAQVGTELIDRTSRPIGLTDAGRALLPEARLAVAHAARAVSAARRAAEGRLGHLTIGAMQSPIATFLPDVLREHRRHYPDVGISLVEQGPGEQIARLRDDRLDAGFVRGPLEDPALATRALLDDPPAAVVPADHPLAAREAIAPAELAGEPFVLADRVAAPTTHADAVALLRGAEPGPAAVQEAGNIHTVLALVAAGFGVSLLPISFAGLRRGGVAFVPLAPPLPSRPIMVAWRAGNPSPTLHAFLDVAWRASRGTR